MNSTIKVKVFAIVRQMFLVSLFIMDKRVLQRREIRGEKLSAIFNRR